jgi:predicted DNA-binding transcriptional regulator AlpA
LAHFDSNKKVVGNRPCRNQEKIMSQINQMRSTGWLAQRLGLSTTTIERLRAQGSPDLPPCRTIGKSKRYDERAVEQWILDAGCANQAQAPQTTGTVMPSAANTLTAQKGAPNGNA